MPMLKRGFKESLAFRPSVNASSKKSFFLIRSLSTTSATLSKLCYARKFTSLPAISRRASFFKRRENLKRTKSVKRSKISSWLMR